MRVLRTAGAIAAGLILILALYVSADASTRAADASSRAKDTARVLAANNYVRATGACRSSTELRSLLNDIDSLLNLAGSTDPETLAVHARIHRYTDHNPNCDHLPPKP